MSGWWTYSLSDVLLFSADTYQRLFERYNEAFWPFQLLPLMAGLTVPLLVKIKPEQSGRWVAALFALCWSWVAWGFHLQRYATIHWGAPVFAAIFIVEAGVLTWSGVFRRRLVFSARSSMLNPVGWGVYYFALIGQPLLYPLLGLSWTQAGLFGSAPDPTAIATIGMILVASNGSHWGLLIIPLIWCAISGATLYAMDSPLAAVVVLAPVIVIVSVLANAMKKQSPSQ